MTSIFDPITYPDNIALALEFLGVVTDGGSPYTYTGSLSLNTETQYNALVWTDMRTKPDYADVVGAFDDSQRVRNENLMKTRMFQDDQLISSLPAFPEKASDILNDSAVSGSKVSDALNALSNKMVRSTSTLTLSLVGTGATGTQIDGSKDSTVRATVSTSATATIAGAATSIVALKICVTNNATEGSWTTVATQETDQNVTLAIALQSIIAQKGQLCADVPAGWYVKLVNSGTGTHSESFVSGQKTIYG